MFKPLMIAALATVATFAAASAEARVNVSIGIGLPFVAPPLPVYAAPIVQVAPVAPIYAPDDGYRRRGRGEYVGAPVSYPEALSYDAPAPRHYAPAPRYYAPPPPRYVAPAPIYYAPAPVYYAPVPAYYGRPVHSGRW